MVFMNARKSNKTITLVIVAAVSLGLLMSVSLFWQGSSPNVSSTNNSPNTGSTEDIALQNFSEGFKLLEASKSQEAVAKFALAITGFEEVVKVNPKNVEALGDLATSYFYTGNVDKAIEVVQKALEISPTFSTARLNYAIYLSEGKNKIAEAINELKKIGPEDTKYSQAQQLITTMNTALSSQSKSLPPINSQVPGTNSGTSMPPKNP